MIELKQLSKSYGHDTVLDELNWTIKAGQVCALLGKNGAGKTTLINLILDLILPTEGSISIFGKDSGDLDLDDKKRIGVLGDELGLIEEFTGLDYLKFIGNIYHLTSSEISNRVADLTNYFFENEDDLKKTIASYSTGMKKKIAFCGAVIHIPDLLILDEPFSALDPLVAKQMILFIKKYANENRTIIISSHDLAYVEKVANHIAVLNETQLVFNGSLEEFTENGQNKIDNALFNFLRPNESELDNISWL